MRNAGLEETLAGIKTAGRNISNLRYADDTTLMAESKEELKSLFFFFLENFYVDIWYHFSWTKILRYGIAELRKCLLIRAAVSVFRRISTFPLAPCWSCHCQTSTPRLIIVSLHSWTFQWVWNGIWLNFLPSHFCLFLQVIHLTEIQKMASWFLHVTKSITYKFRNWTWENQYFHTRTETNPREVCRIRETKQKWARIEYHGDLKVPVMYSVPFLSVNCFSEGVLLHYKFPFLP